MQAHSRAIDWPKSRCIDIAGRKRNFFDEPKVYCQNFFECAEREFDVIFFESEIATLNGLLQAVMPWIGRSCPYEVLLDYDMD